MAKVKSRIWQYFRQPWRLAVPLKRIGILFGLIFLVSASYYWAIRNLRTEQHLITSIVLLWVATAYYVLPRIHRLLSRIYVPHYFIGRARTIDGLLADPVNLALRGNKKMLVKSMHKAGWTEADPITLVNAMKIILATLRRLSYQAAPVSDMFVFGRKQTFAFQKEVNGNPAKRHHVRFWQVEKDIYLPGGYNVDWVGAASYDNAVDFSLFTLQITHSIDGDVDVERDFVVETLRKARRTKKIQRIESFFPGYQHRNGGGDKFFTDGSMVIVDLKSGIFS